jgi:hypothetical protein
MRGNTRRSTGDAVPACVPRGLAGAFRPRAPRPRGALPLVGSPAPERFVSGTPDRWVRPLGTRAQGALLPETPARQEGRAPFPPYPRMQRASVPA